MSKAWGRLCDVAWVLSVLCVMGTNYLLLLHSYNKEKRILEDLNPVLVLCSFQKLTLVRNLILAAKNCRH